MMLANDGAGSVRTGRPVSAFACVLMQGNCADGTNVPDFTVLLAVPVGHGLPTGASLAAAVCPPAIMLGLTYEAIAGYDPSLRLVTPTPSSRLVFIDP